ncbi:MAG: saccharopine dehydrogenase C-terminal domain-containing protein [Candidatus Caldatribacteriota bacterium]|nr:saccharopine dehydrogenase C-terminal domain-containing protein [Candidatus Caldatribacteriota bacterium]
MKVLVFGGSGKMGSAVAWDLAKNSKVGEVGIIGITGRRENALEKTKNWINSDKIVLHAIDVNNREETMKLMGKYDVGAITLPDRKCSYKVVDMAIEAGLNIVDILEEYHRKPDKYEVEGLEIPNGITLDEYGESLHQKAIKNGVTFIDGMGFAPGLTNITLGEGIKKMDRADLAIARCGGIPAKDFANKHPLKYMITWAFEHVLREYMVKVDVMKDGKIVEANAMDDLEKFRFNQLGKDEELACAITPGMPSFLYTRPQLKECAEKTIRWPGHWEGAGVLKECGMLDSTPVEFKGIKISPREFLSHIMTPKLQPLQGETDVCVMWNTVTGIKDGQKMRIDYYMWEEADTENGISAMGRVTAFPEAIATVMLGKGEITKKGIVAPEDAIEGKIYENFLEELKRRKINILEVSSKI